MNDQRVKTDNEVIAEAGYEVLEDGRIQGKSGRILKLYPSSTSDYIQFNASISGRQSTFLVHRLVAEKYVPNPDNLPEVNHEDGNKRNNHKDNLKWCTRPQNIQHGFITGLIQAPWSGKSGGSHNRSKSVQQIKNEVVVAEFGSIREAAKLTGIHRATIDQVLSGKGKTAGGFQWRYKE